MDAVNGLMQGALAALGEWVHVAVAAPLFLVVLIAAYYAAK